jgi:uncharacterized protein (DUF1330 family)
MTYIWNHETQEKVNRLLVVSAFNGRTINREDTFVNGEGEHKESLFYVLKFSSEKPSAEWYNLSKILQDYDQTGWIYSHSNIKDGFKYSIELSFYVCPKTKQIGH